MGLTAILLMQLTMIIIMLAVAVLSVAAATNGLHPPEDCVRRCGGVQIPYPFGLNESCALDKETFLIRCVDKKYPVVGHENLNITHISIEKNEISILSYVARDCYSVSGEQVSNSCHSLRAPMFSISNSRNKFTVIGCASYAYLNGYQNGDKYSLGCTSICKSLRNVSNKSCSGVGCCQTQIPQGLNNFTVDAYSFYNHNDTISFNNCTYAFIAEDNFTFSVGYLTNFPKERIPLVLDWAIASNNACGLNSHVISNQNGRPGYNCNCKPGFRGNPYLPNGCQDINECEEGHHNCTSINYCNNEEGTYNCSCPSNFIGDGRKDGVGCQDINECEEKMGDGRKDGVGCQKKTMPFIYKVLIGIATGFVIMVSSCWIHLIRKQKKISKLKEKLFRQNGGLILLQQLSRLSQQEDVRVKIFTEDELRKATHNYDDSAIIGQGGFGTVYKGILAHNKVVAIKKSKIVDQSQIEQFINEVVVVSQINHRNVVKLLGCCLDSQVPLLVYEYVPNGALSEHLHDKDKASNLQWEIRLDIATETAGVLSYLHSAASTPIIHRDVKPSNILLDNYTAKISDFGASRLVPLDQTGVATMVQGTFGYLDPEYLLTNQLTEKSDVYSFGVVLVELLTGQKALSFDRTEEERSLAYYFLSFFKKNQLFEILESHIAKNGNETQLKEVAELAKRCLNVKGEDRPAMKEVAMELEGIRKIEKHPWVTGELNLEEAKSLLGESSNAYEEDTTTHTNNSYNSIIKEEILDLSGR